MMHISAIEAISAQKAKLKRIRVVCPICEATGSIQENEVLLRRYLDTQGDNMLEITIFPEEICKHGFIVRVDSNLKAR